MRSTRPRRLLLVLACVFGLPVGGIVGCSTVDFVPTLRSEIELFPELATLIESDRVRPWHVAPPQEITPDLSLYYVLEFESPEGREQYLLRVAPTAELAQPVEFDEADDRKPDRDPERWARALFEGLLEEFGTHTERWLAEREGALRELDLFGDDEANSYRVFVDTLGPIDASGDATERSWRRADTVAVSPVFFDPDFVTTCERARHLQSLPPGRIDPAERDAILFEVARSKFKLFFAILTVAKSSALRKIAERVIEMPSGLAVSLIAARYVIESQYGFLGWMVRSCGVRFDESHSDFGPHGLTGTERVRFRVDPRLSTTQILLSEVTATRNENAPLLSAGFLGLEGINPYDERRRFRIALIGWRRGHEPHRLLSGGFAEFRFSPDGGSATSRRDGEVILWQLPRTDDDPWVHRLDGPEWRCGTWSPDGGHYFGARGNGTIDRVELAPTFRVVHSVARARGARIDRIEATPDGRHLVVDLRREDDARAVEVVATDDLSVIARYDGYRLAPAPLSPSEPFEIALSTDEGVLAPAHLELDPAVRLVVSAASVPTGDPEPGPPADEPKAIDWDEERELSRIRTPRGVIEVPVCILSGCVDPTGRWLIGFGIDASGIPTSALWDLRGYPVVGGDPPLGSSPSR